MQELSLEDFSPTGAGQQLIASLSHEKAIDISIAYKSEFKSAKGLREIVDSISKGLGVDPKWRTRLVLIIDELNNNAIEYGSQTGDTNYMNVKLIPGDENNLFIDVSVIDTGRGEHSKNASYMQEIKKQHENKDFSEHHSIRGRGLFLIISHLVDELYFMDSHSGGLIVGARKNLLKVPRK